VFHHQGLEIGWLQLGVGVEDVCRSEGQFDVLVGVGIHVVHDPRHCTTL